MRRLLLAAIGGLASASNATARRRLSRTPRDSFYDIAKRTQTDKVQGVANLGKSVHDADSINPRCQVFGHFYHTAYERWLPRRGEPSYQFVEVGYSGGRGFDAFLEYLPNAEAHSLEISCDGTAKRNPRFAGLLANERIHCGNANSLGFLEGVWAKMRRRDAPPLKVVVDDGSHQAAHMVQTVFFWFPRLAPRGVLFVEDIQPTASANKFRSKFLPQIMSDVHWCGSRKRGRNRERFPTLRPLLASVSCELHICVFERNDEPATPDLSRELSAVPPHALDPNKFRVGD